MSKRQGVKDADGLTKRQRAFADLYIKDPYHPQDAARAAGYAETTSTTIWQKILRLDAVAAYISKRMPAADEERAREARKQIATGDEVTAFLSKVMRGEIKDAFGLDAGLSDRISAAKELRRIYDVIDKARASGTLQDDLSKSLAEFAQGIYQDDEDEDAAPRTSTQGTHKGSPERSQEMGGSPSVVDSDPTPTPTQNISLSTDNKTQLPRESVTDSGDFQNEAPQKNFENPITGA